MNNSITAFLKELRQAFPMLSEKEKQFYKDISNSVWVFAEQNPGCTKEDLFEYFGEPKKIASVYYSNMDSVTFYTKLNKVNRVNWMLLACIVFLAAIAIVILYLSYTASVAAHKGTAGINIIQAFFAPSLYKVSLSLPDLQFLELQFFTSSAAFWMNKI